MDAILDYLNGPGVASLAAAELGGALESVGTLSAKFAAARAAILARFDAGRAHDFDGYGSSAAWLTATSRMTRKAAGAQVRQMRVLKRHPVFAEALARGELSESWLKEMADWTSKLPVQLREGIDKLLADTAAAGADLDDLAVVARAAYEKWRSQQPDPDDPEDRFDDRYLKLGATIDNAGRVTGNLTPECTTALQAVLDSLGKRRGPQDDRSEPQRFHDALQEACELLIGAQMVPARAGADTRVDVVVALSQLRDLPGASAIEEAWLAALAGQPGYLAGRDARAAACDALTTPVVTGHPDLAVVDQMINLVLAVLDQAEAHHAPADAAVDDPAVDDPAVDDPGADDPADDPGDDPAAREGDAPEGTAREGTARPGGQSPQTLSPLVLSPQAWQALRYGIARLAVDLVSGPGGLASALRTGLLDAPYNSRSVPLDIGYSHTIPASIRRAVALRDRHCAWPGCGKPPAHCDVHHLRHQQDGGETSVANCVLLCQFHHDICIHRWNWRLVLHPDGTTTAYGPKGQILPDGLPAGVGA
jgi:hypothetical protein